MALWVVALVGLGAVGTAVCLLARAPTLRASSVPFGAPAAPGQPRPTERTGESPSSQGQVYPSVPGATPPSAAPREQAAALPAVALSGSSAPPAEVNLSGRGPWPTDPTGALPDGRLMVPADPSHVGWWSGGAAPGDASGSVVLVGHLDSATQGLGVFAVLLDVTLGAPIVVTDTGGQRHRYVVSSRTQIPRAALPATLFDRSGPRQLVLITCGGRYDRTAHRYDDNVVVVARPAD